MACNYDEMANTDNGLCELPGDECDDMDDMTFNDVINDSCACVGTLIVLGCLDSTACNYDMDANMDRGLCAFPGDACDDMDENTTNDTYDEDCGCVGEEIVLGCTDEDACNYDAELGANVDDGSCLYEDVLGECGGDVSPTTMVTAFAMRRSWRVVPMTWRATTTKWLTPTTALVCTLAMFVTTWMTTPSMTCTMIPACG